MFEKIKEKDSIYENVKDNNLRRLIVFLFIILIFALLIKPGAFFQVSNFQSIGKQLSEYGLMALGVGVCMIAGGIDLSSVYVANLTGISAALLMQKLSAVTTIPSSLIIPLVILIGILIGMVCGALNGILIAYFNIPAMLATLGTYQLFMGISIVISKGSTVGNILPAFAQITKNQILGIPISFVVFIVAAIILNYVMSHTKLGKRIYLVGTNKKTAEYAGVKTKNVTVRLYMISGMLAALAGLLSLSRITSAKADFGSSYTMQTILISVLGGVNPDGGFGNIKGITVSVIILQTLSSLLNMFPSISNYYRDLIWGVALILVLILNFVINKRNNQKLQQRLNE